MATTNEAIVVGSTGGVGQHILETVIDLQRFGAVHAYTRREFEIRSEKLNPIISKDSSAWPSQFPKLPDPSTAVFFSGLGTTRAAAGGFANQYKIDHDLNVDLAKTAKAAGVRTYVLISAQSPNSKSMFGYVRMKGEIEERIKELGFEHTIFLRPGFIAGARSDSNKTSQGHGSFAEGVLRAIANGAGNLGNGLKDFWAQDRDVIARAAVAAALQAQEGKAPNKVWVLGASDIVRLGRTEWTASNW